MFSISLLQGCASAYKSDTTHSLAWNISKASDIRVDEIPEKKLKQVLGDSYDIEETSVIAKAAIDTGIVNSALLSTQGFLTLGQLGASLGLSLLFHAAQPDDPHFKDHTLAWMPVSLAENEEDAAKHMIKVAVEALKNMPETHRWKVDWSKTYKELSNLETPFLSNRYEYNLYFKGDECDVFDCTLFIYLFEPEITLKPDFLNYDEDNAYHFKPDGHAFPNASLYCELPNKVIDNLRMFKSGKALVNDSEYDFDECRKTAAALRKDWISWMPSWFFIYAPPTKSSLPYLSNKDRVLLYVEPDSL